MNKRALLPNAITTGNCLFGFYAITQVLENNLNGAALAIIAAAVFDLFDGRVARMVKGSSEFGEQFDSLSDFLSFGIAPAAVIYLTGLATFGGWAWVAAFAYLFAVAVRLARFGVKTRPSRKGFFEGLSSPPAASTLAAFVLFLGNFELGTELHAGLFVALALFLAVLMVSSLAFPTFKHTDWKSTAGRIALTLGVCGVVTSIYRPSVFLFLWGFGFVMGVLVWNVVRMARGDRAGALS